MKKIKLLFLFLTVSVLTLSSCADENPVNNPVNTDSSISLRTTLKQIKKTIGAAGRDGSGDQALCFNFVYPLTLSYNNGTTVEVTSFDGLITLLEQETGALYLDGIEFPFQVQEEGTVTTINNEDEFMALVESCGFDTIDEELYVFDCYEIVYPFSVINQNNETVVVDDEQELYALFASPASGSDNYIVDFVYPLTLTGNGQTYQANNIYELFDLFDECTGNTDCICPTDYNPVCVNDGSGGIITFSNPCQAECAGYTEADFMDCGIVQPVNFGSLLGNCFFVSYPVQVQYQGALVTVNNDGELLQYWFPSQGDFPQLHYPISISGINPVSNTIVNSEDEFRQIIVEHCN